MKTGFFQGDSAAVIGALTVADIGIRLLEAAYFLEEGETLPFPLRSIPLEDVSGSDPILVEKETR